MAHAAMPVLADEAGLARYLLAIRKSPMLEAGEERHLAERWREFGDTAAAHKLVTSHLRLVAKIAMKYRGYGLPVCEIFSEGAVGLMRAITRFEPQRGFRLSTYALCWIRASIQDYVLRSWSLVRVATTANQRRLFFNLRKAKARISAWEENLRPGQVKQIAADLRVSERDVVEMNPRLYGDVSLNTPLGEGEGEWLDWFADSAVDQESELVEEDERRSRVAALEEVLLKLDPRERRIFEARRLADDPVKLEVLSSEFGVSRERVRQIEVYAFAKVQKAVRLSVALREAQQRKDRAVQTESAGRLRSSEPIQNHLRRIRRPTDLSLRRSPAPDRFIGGRGGRRSGSVGRLGGQDPA